MRSLRASCAITPLQEELRRRVAAAIDRLPASEREVLVLKEFDDLNVKLDSIRDEIVWWDETGFCLWYKRLEQAKFAWPRKAVEPVLELTETQLNWLLQGYDILRMVPHQRLNYGV